MNHELSVIESPMKKVLITGNNGFIGSKLSARFIDRKDCMVHLYGMPYADILDTESLEMAFRAHKPDVVVHLAAQTRLRYSLEHVQEDAMTNIIGSINVFGMAAKCGVRNIIYTSTGGARYGEWNHSSLDESMPVKPVSPYGISKRVAEEYLRYYGNKYKINSVALCLGNVYGPGDNLKNGRVIPRILDAMKSGKEFTMYGDGSSARDYVYIDDVVDLIERMAMNGFKAPNFIYNISNDDCSLETIINIILDITRKDFKINQIDNIKGEIDRVVLDCSLAKEDLEWNPKIDIHEGLERTVRSYGL